VAAAAALNEGAREAYALCRPPGHHARAEAAGGFCYLNNAAIAAQALRERFGRVAILDTDMHHGQGVQEIFYGRDDVLYVSIHGDPTNFYPVVAGYEDERGAGEGDGYNINLPMPHGSGEEVFFDQLEVALRAVRRFQPDALVLALGFDIYKDDPQAMVAVTTEGFGRLGGAIGGLGLPTVIVQEGGYHIDSLRDNARAFFGGFSRGGAGG
jgi:acetoin utilization deacetylase AcuC-like enzyme